MLEGKRGAGYGKKSPRSKKVKVKIRGQRRQAGRNTHSYIMHFPQY